MVNFVSKYTREALLNAILQLIYIGWMKRVLFKSCALPLHKREDLSTTLVYQLIRYCMDNPQITLTLLWRRVSPDSTTSSITRSDIWLLYGFWWIGFVKKYSLRFLLYPFYQSNEYQKMRRVSRSVSFGVCPIR